MTVKLNIIDENCLLFQGCQNLTQSVLPKCQMQKHDYIIYLLFLFLENGILNYQVAIQNSKSSNDSKVSKLQYKIKSIQSHWVD
jgi:hypothetical protein